LAGQKI